MSVGNGQVIGGRYELVSKLGSGGFGRVWRARDTRLGVDVAVKEMHLPKSLSDEERAEFLARAEREAANAARLRGHPNIVTVYDVIEVDGAPWIVMQLADGNSLADELSSGPLPEARVISLGRGLLKALKAAHGIGLAHRDIKPANVLLTTEGQILLTDFGIAVHETDSKITATHMVLATPGYAAPERWQGIRGDVRSDIYSLGVTLYEAAEGELPFPKDDLLAAQHQAPRATGRAEPLAGLLREMLAGAPEDRPTADEALKRLAQPEEAKPHPPTQVNEPGSIQISWTGNEPLSSYTNSKMKRSLIQQWLLALLLCIVDSLCLFYFASIVDVDPSSMNGIQKAMAVVIPLVGFFVGLVVPVQLCFLLNATVRRVKDDRARIVGSRWSLIIGSGGITTATAAGSDSFAWKDIQRVVIQRIQSSSLHEFTGVHLDLEPTAPPFTLLRPAGWPYQRLRIVTMDPAMRPPCVFSAL